MSVDDDQVPDKCPLCHTGIHPVYVYARMFRDKCDIVYRCPIDRCGKLFIGTYVVEGGMRRPFLISVEPKRFRNTPFPDEIANLSPSFSGIYNQAAHAEALGLDQVCGVGYRKAFEFLIKDYAGYKNPEKKESVVRTPLSACIDTFVTDANVTACAKRATWLGNDETHYIRTWSDKDIDDLKILIRLSINWIQNDLLTEHYRKEMPEKKR